MFGSTEHKARSVARAESARQRVLAWLADGRTAGGSGGSSPRASTAGGSGVSPAGLVVTGPGAVAWVTGGIAPPVDRAASVDLVWAIITAAGSWLVTTNVEAARIRAEYDPARHGFAGVAEVPWHTPEAFACAAADLAGVPTGQLASDGHQAFGIDASDHLIALRLALSASEVDDLTDLGRDAAHAVQSALAQWQPGERDLDIQARCAALIESAGADAPVMIVGGDDRLRAYRHPMAVGAPVRELAMVVVVARRAGLHVALTRFAAAGRVDPAYAALRGKVLAIEDAVLDACVPGASYGQALDALSAGYAASGAVDGWKGHYQGGPVGYAQREFEIAPGQAESRWYAQPIAPAHAIAWNPSLPGGAKAEDTYLVTGGPDPGTGPLSRLTDAPGWPQETTDSRRPQRPAVLEVGT